MSNPLISIILPVYNVEKYLRSSLDSILCQDTSDCEILLINDGSKDDSLAILREYENKHNNIFVIDKPNEGVSKTRNLGLNVCRGEYFYFMDSDDRLHPELFNLLRKEICLSHPDIIVWDFAVFYTRPKISEIPKELKIEQVNNHNKEAFNYLMANDSAVSLWNKAIRRSLIGGKVRLNPSLTYGEDMFFCWKTILLANSIRYIRFPLYYYLQTQSSATSRFHPNLYENYRKAFDDIREFVKNQGIETSEVLASIDFHFAQRLPALTSMETRAPYSREKQIMHLSHVLDDEYIQRGLNANIGFSHNIYQLAKERKVAKMLFDARMKIFIARILYPIKTILK